MQQAKPRRGAQNPPPRKPAAKPRTTSRPRKPAPTPRATTAPTGSAGRRLAAFLADAGVASRRKAEVLVREGRASVNGAVILDPAHAVRPGSDRVAVDGKAVRVPAARTYLLLNKPRGYLSACGDPGGKPTVLDLIPSGGRRLYPVGRLDFNAEGLILLTDDGALALRLTHPRYQVPRTYLVKVKGRPEAAELRRLTHGVREGGEFLKAREVRPSRRTEHNAWFEVVLTEGKNREVRRLFSAIGYLVVRIIRIAFGPLSLGTLKTGEFRLLTREEIGDLRALGDHGP